MKENSSSKEFEEIVELLDKAPYVDSFTYEDGDFLVKMNLEKVMLIAFSFKTFICPTKLLTQIKNTEDDLERALLIFILDAFIEKIANNTGVISDFLNEPIKIEFGDRDLALFEFVDTKKPYKMGDYCYFTCKVPDFFNEFKEFIYSNVHRIGFRFFKCEETPKSFIKMTETFEKCGVACTIPRLAELGEWSEDEVVKVLWEMLKNGLARVIMPVEN